jgi:hypothetical protein
MSYDEDQVFVNAVRDCMADEDSWVLASSVATRLGPQASARVVGIRLAKIAKAGRVERRWDKPFACWLYRTGAATG